MTRRAPADRAAVARRVPRPGPQVRRRPARRGRRRPDARRARPMGVGVGPTRDRPDAAGRRARLGRQAAAARGLPRSGTASTGIAPAAAGRPAVRRRPSRQGALPPAGRPRRDEDAARAGRRPRAAVERAARRTPGPTSAASACGATARRWSRRRGTRSSSTSGASRWSGCRWPSRCAARRRTWVSCSTAVPTPPRWSRRWSARR